VLIEGAPVEDPAELKEAATVFKAIAEQSIEFEISMDLNT